MTLARRRSGLAELIAPLWRILTRRQRRYYLAMVAMLALAAVLEALGIGLLLPLLAVMTRPDTWLQDWGLPAWLGVIGEWSMVGMLALFLAVNGVRIGYLAVLAWLRAALNSDVQADLSQRLYREYLCQPYWVHLAQNTAQLTRMMTTEAREAGDALDHQLALVAECMVMLGVILLLLLVEPVSVLSVFGLLAAAAWWLQRTMRGRLSAWGRVRTEREARRVHELQQGLSCVREVKLARAEAVFADAYADHERVRTRALRHLQFALALPRLWLELLMVVGIGLFILTLLLQGRPMEAAVPVLGVVAAAALRMMPSLNRILQAIQSVQQRVPVLEHLAGELDGLRRHRGRLPTADRDPGAAAATAGSGANKLLAQALKVSGLSYRYPGANAMALTDVGLTVPRRAMVGLVGASGAGKTTLVHLLLGLLAPTAGRIEVDGRDIQEDLVGWQCQIGFVPQSIQMMDASVRANVAFGIVPSRIDEAAVWRALTLARLDAFVRSLPDGVDTLVGEQGGRLSGGQRQRLGIARALYHQPSVLVLDEAGSALDQETEHAVMDAVQSLKAELTLIVVTHRAEMAARCDWLYRLEAGQVVASGTPAVSGADAMASPR